LFIFAHSRRTSSALASIQAFAAQRLCRHTGIKRLAGQIHQRLAIRMQHMRVYRRMLVAPHHDDPAFTGMKSSHGAIIEQLFPYMQHRSGNPQ
jgi:hypothetical protein